MATPLTTEEFVDKHKLIYDALNPVYCKLLKETVNFTSEGFTHLVFKKGHKRPKDIIEDRLPLIRLAIPVITHAPIVSKTEVRDEIYKGREMKVTYYELIHFVGKRRNTKVKVVLKRRGKLGNLFFQSIMRMK